MKILVVGRTYPSKKNGSVGLFEYEQAKALSLENSIKYLFIDNQSIKKHFKFNKYQSLENKVVVYGKYFPMGGINKKVFDVIKYEQFKKGFKKLYKGNDKPDVIHFHYPLITSNEYILNFILEKQIKIVITEHWSKVQKLEITEKQKKYYNRLAKHSTLISVSNGLKKSMELIIDNPVNIHVLPNFIDENIFYIKNLENNNKLISIGSLTKIKNNEFLLRNAINSNISVEENCNMLTIVGDGPEKEKLNKIIQSAQIKNILIAGFRDKKILNDMLNKSSVYVSTSLVETFGVPVVESWYTGTPTIICNTHPLAPYINEANGFTYEDGNELDLINKLEEACNCKWDKEVIRESALEVFSMKKMIERLTNIYGS